MKALSLLMAVVLLAGCGSPKTRIKRNQAAFDSYPTEIQQKIREGRADVGFTPEQVQMALGKPDRVYTRKSASGTQEVWAYGDSNSRVGFGLGYGMWSGGNVYDAGVSVGTGQPDYYPEDKIRVVFEGGKVTTLETKER